jgi:hypothetical protein
MTIRMQVSVLALAAAAGWAAPVQAQDAAAMQAELAQMRAQMQAMSQRIDTLEGQLAAANARADAATTTASQAATTAAAASNAATQAQASGDKAGVLATAAKWAADTKISGRMYFNASTVSADDAAGNRVERDSGFEIKRMYVGIDHRFDDTFSGNVTMDVARVDNAGKNVGLGFYVKKAYLEAKLSDAVKVRLGSADTPWVPYAEGIYGYRHIERETLDLYGFGTSADWGVHVGGDVAGGLVSYQVSAVDGGGYRDPKLTRTVDFEGRVSLKYHGFNAGVGGYTGKLGTDVEGAPAYRRATRVDALLAYKDKLGGMPVTLGGEYFSAKNWRVLEASPEDRAEGYSLFASLSPVERWSAFGRYDWVKPNKDTAPARKADLFTVGLQWSPANIVDLALVWKRDESEGGLRTGNLAAGQAQRDEFGLYGQFRF